jgi:hypothetical protein
MTLLNSRPGYVATRMIDSPTACACRLGGCCQHQHQTATPPAQAHHRFEVASNANVMAMNAG